MKTFSQKKEELAQVEDKLKRSRLTIFTTFARSQEKGLSVAQMRELRKALREADAEYLVSKKTLLNKALHDAKKPSEVLDYEGSLGVVFGYGDEITVAKSIHAFGKKNPSLKYLGALFGLQSLSTAQITELAKLPGREVLISQALGMITYPIRGLFGVLQANTRGLVSVLSQIAAKK